MSIVVVLFFLFHNGEEEAGVLARSILRLFCYFSFVLTAEQGEAVLI
jgi:hypothetical protein